MKLSEKGEQIQKSIHDLYKDCLDYCHEAEKYDWVPRERTYKMASILDTFLEKFKHLNNHIREEEKNMDQPDIISDKPERSVTNPRDEEYPERSI